MGDPNCFKPASVSNRHAAVGAKTLTSFGSTNRCGDRRNNCRSTPGDGRRSVQERNWASNGFMSFMRLSFQTSPEFLQAITISSCCRVRRYFQQLTDLLKRVFVPEFQYDHFALRYRQFCQTPHRRPLRVRLLHRPLEPAMRLKFPRHPSPERAPVIKCAIPKAAHAVMFRLLRGFLTLQQRYKSLLHHVLRLGMRQPQRATV